MLAFHSCRQNEKQVAGQSQVNDSNALPVYSIPKPDSAFIVSIARNLRVTKVDKARLIEFYSNRKYTCAWFNQHGLTEQAGEVVNMVRDYIEGGVFSADYLLPGIVELHDSVSAEDFSPVGNDTLLLKADVMFTIQFLLFSETVWKGKADQASRLEWFLPLKKFSQVDYLAEILDEDTSEVLGSEPVYRQYHRLRERIKQYVEIKKKGGWEQIIFPGKTVNPGEDSPLVSDVRKRLEVTGDYTGTVLSENFDSSFVKVISEIRASYGMEGAQIDERLIQELNIPVEDRIRKMSLNLERWKWIPPDPGENYLAVNIPEYMLHVFESGKRVKSMRVIVGKSVNKTVIFSGNLKSVVFSPYWVIPRSIIVKETLPAVKRDRSYLRKHRMELFSYSNPEKNIHESSIDFSKYSSGNFPYGIRQKPGPGNSLGKVKFLFPNSFSIYLHDTPSQYLFEKEERSFSHGCIRLSEPAWLAEYLLRNDSSWNPRKIEKAMNASKEQTVLLKEAVPVYLTYFTSWIDANGRLNFRDDIYGHDKKLEHLLFN